MSTNTVIAFQLGYYVVVGQLGERTSHCGLCAWNSAPGTLRLVAKEGANHMRLDHPHAPAGA